MNFFKSFGSSGTGTTASPPAPSQKSSGTITVKWGKERLSLPIEDFSTCTLYALRSQISQLTSLASDSFKLVFSGGVMTGELTPLTKYGIKNGSTLAIIGGESAATFVEKERKTMNKTNNKSSSSAQKTTPSGARLTQPILMQQIKTRISSSLADLTPLLDEFEAIAGNSNIQYRRGSPAFDVILKKQAVLNEKFLQGLLWLDGLEVDPSWLEAKKERKEGVKTIQAHLDRVDKAWSAIKANTTAA